MALTKTTTVINLFAGSGSGKSTTAAGLFSRMKLKDLDVELVREYVKDWAWLGHKPEKYDQMYIMGKQIRAESLLYHKVDYIVTDSPFLLGPFYEEHHLGKIITRPSALNFYQFAQENGIHFANYFLVRRKKFNPKGRYETEDQAKQIDEKLKIWLNGVGIPYVIVDVPDDKRIDTILRSVLRS